MRGFGGLQSFYYLQLLLAGDTETGRKTRTISYPKTVSGKALKTLNYMNTRLIHSFILISILFFVFNNFTIAQTLDRLNKTEIDSLLRLQVQNSNKIDTLFSLTGFTKFYNKLGFIKIRTGTGFSDNYKVICNEKLYMALNFSKKVKKKRYEIYIYKYFYIDNKLYKYESTEVWEDRNDNSESFKHNVVIYFNNNEVIDSEVDIRDRYKYSKININTIIENSINISENTKINETPNR